MPSGASTSLPSFSQSIHRALALRGSTIAVSPHSRGAMRGNPGTSPSRRHASRVTTTTIVAVASQARDRDRMPPEPAAHAQRHIRTLRERRRLRETVDDAGRRDPCDEPVQPVREIARAMRRQDRADEPFAIALVVRVGCEPVRLLFRIAQRLRLPAHHALGTAGAEHSRGPQRAVVGAGDRFFRRVAKVAAGR